MISISIIVPVYNVDKYVEKCLVSLRNQTLTNIEIICVNDASTDLSGMIIDKAANDDNRIKVIHLKKNQGTLCARKHGLAIANGHYVMFVDSDDWLELNACESLYKLMERHSVDILQYGTNVIPAVSVSEELISWVENFSEPYEMRVEGRNILNSCFVKGKFDFNIKNKICNVNICKKIIPMLEKGQMVAAEDGYMFFLLAYFAKSYVGVGNTKYYNYNLGIGITGSDILDLERFKKRCSGAISVRAVEHFLNRLGVRSQYQEEYNYFKNKILWDCVDCWYNKLEQKNQGKGYDILLMYWKSEEVLAAIARRYFENQSDIESKTRESKVRKKKCVGLFYRYSEYVGMQSYLYSQILMIEKAGNEVVLFADKDANLKDKLLNYNVVFIPSSKNANWDCYEERAAVFANELRNRNIKLMVYASPTSHIAWLDRLLFESMSINTFNLGDELIFGNKKQIRSIYRLVQRLSMKFTGMKVIVARVYGSVKIIFAKK